MSDSFLCMMVFSIVLMLSINPSINSFLSSIDIAVSSANLIFRMNLILSNSNNNFCQTLCNLLKIAISIEYSAMPCNDIFPSTLCYLLAALNLIL